MELSRTAAPGAIAGTGVPAGDYTYYAPFLSLNISVEYRLYRQAALFAAARNVFNQASRTERYSPSTPEYARLSGDPNVGMQLAVGIKGSF